jgi:integrase
MPTIDEAVESFMQHRMLRGVRSGSLVLYRRWLQFWQAWRAQRGLSSELAAVTVGDLRDFFLYARQEHAPHGHPTKRGLSPGSLDSLWRLLSAFWTYCDGEGWLTVEQSRFFRSGRIPRPRRPDRIHDTYDAKVLDTMLDACIGMHHPGQQADPEQEARDQVILLLLASSGMRIGELESLHDAHVDLVQMQAQVTGKSGPRWVFWDERTATALRRYLELRSGPPSGPLLRSTWGQRRGRDPLSTSALRAMIKRVAARAGVRLIPHAPIHGWRATFIQTILDNGASTLDAQQLAGHESPRTTQIYAKRAARSLRRVYDRVRPGQDDTGHHQS